MLCGLAKPGTRLANGLRRVATPPRRHAKRYRAHKHAAKSMYEQCEVPEVTEADALYPSASQSDRPAAHSAEPMQHGKGKITKQWGSMNFQP